jgi:uncharacterized protein involved in cysteine biosynthesis
VNSINLRSDARELAAVPLQAFKAALTIIRSPRLLLLSIIPTVCGIIAFFVALYFFFDWRRDLAVWLIGDTYNWLEVVLSWILFFVNFFTSGVIALIVSSLLGGVFIEAFIEESLKINGMQLNQPFSMARLARTIKRSAKEGLVRLLILCVVMGCFLIAMIFPPASILAIFLSAALLGFDIFDLPASMLDHPLSFRTHLARSYPLTYLGLGGLMTLALAVPLGGVIFMPVAYYLAVIKLAGWGVRPAD